MKKRQKSFTKFISVLLCVLMAVSAVVVPVEAKVTETEISGKMETTEVKFKQVKVSPVMTAAISEDNSLYTWGFNGNCGYLGIGNNTLKNDAVPTKIMDNVISVYLGYDMEDLGLSCFAITKDGSLFSWGYNRYGRLGDGTNLDKYLPTKILDNVSSVSLGWYYNAAITKDDSLYMWGNNYYGQLGDGSTTDSYTPLKIMEEVSSVSLGYYHSAALKKDGSLYMWGENLYGQLGDGTTINCLQPKYLTDDIAFVDLEYESSAAITSNGSLYTWGNNYYGILGDGTNHDNPNPQKILDDVSCVSLNSRTAIQKNGNLFLWDSSFAGSIPKKVFDNVKQMGGRYSITALTKDGKLFTHKNGNMNFKMENVDSFDSCYENSAAITKDGSLYLWGNNEYGQLGNGTTSNSYSDTPTKLVINKMAIDNFTLKDTVFESAKEYDPVYLNGKLSITFDKNDKEKAEECVQNELNSILWSSSDPDITEVTSVEASVDTFKSTDTMLVYNLKIGLTPYSPGKVTLTGTTTNGITASCSVQMNMDTDYEGYSKDFEEWFKQESMRRALNMTTSNGSFAHCIFVQKNDKSFGDKVVRFTTNAIYKGLDGYKELFYNKTSIDDAERILAALMKESEIDTTELSKAKSANKIAKLFNSGVKNYIKVNALYTSTNNTDFEKINKYLTDEKVAKLIMDGDYGELVELTKKDCGFKDDSEIVQLLKAYMRSDDWAKKISKGLSFMGNGLKLMSISADILERTYEYEALYNTNVMYLEYLAYLRDNCPDEVVSTAAKKLYDMVNGSMKETTDYVFRSIKDELDEKVIDTVFDVAIDAIPYGVIIKASFDFGTGVANAIFKTKDQQDLKDSMRSIAYIGDTLSTYVLKNVSNYNAETNAYNKKEYAKKIVYSMRLLINIRADGEKTLQSYLETIGNNKSTNKYYTMSRSCLNTMNIYIDNFYNNADWKKMINATFGCPVDVEILDSKGNCVLTIKDGEEVSDNYNNEIYYECFYHPIDKDYVKLISLPEDSGYSYRLKGLDNGTVDCSMSKVMEDGTVKYSQLNNVPINDNTVIEIPHTNMDSGISCKVQDKSETLNVQFEEVECDKDISAEKIELSETSLKLKPTESVQLKSAVKPNNATFTNVYWTSSDETVATVTNEGIVTAIADGTAEIIVTNGEDEVKAICVVTVGEEQTKPDTDTDTDTPKPHDTDTDTDKPTPTKPNKFGDIDGDGSITAADSLLILRRSVNLEKFTKEQEKLADVDSDGEITAADSLEVLRASVGLPANSKIGKLI